MKLVTFDHEDYVIAEKIVEDEGFCNCEHYPWDSDCGRPFCGRRISDVIGSVGLFSDMHYNNFICMNGLIYIIDMGSPFTGEGES